MIDSYITIKSKDNDNDDENNAQNKDNNNNNNKKKPKKTNTIATNKTLITEKTQGKRKIKNLFIASKL